MKGFKNTTRMVSGHTHVPASQFHTFGKPNPGQRMATGGTINHLAHGGPVEHAHDDVHGLHEKGGVRDMHPYGEDHAAVLRKVPATALEEEHGGKGPLTPGYAKGGGTHKHFHVHHHHHSGGKVKTHSKHYGAGGSLRKMEMQAEEEAHAGHEPKGHTGETRDRLETGGTINRMRKGGMHINPAHKGKFTKKMTGSKHGHLTGHDVERGLHSKSAETRKEANFARMARRGFKKLNKGGPTAPHPQHAGKKVGGQGQVRKSMAKGGWAGGSGHIQDHTHTEAPDYGHGGRACKATGGTINKLGAGGALYHKGGHHESAHEKSKEHGGFRSELSNLRHKLKD